MSTCWLQYMEAVKVIFYDLVQKVSLWLPRKRSETDTMSRDFWMPDQSCRVCYECDTPFSIFNRRHHCRICGRVFCWKCTQHTLPVVLDGVEEWQGGEKVRVCNFCYKLKQEERRQIDESKNAVKPPTVLVTPSPSNFSLSSSSGNTSRNSMSSSSSSSSSASSSASGNPRQMPLPYGFRTSMIDKIEPIAERQPPRRRHGRRSRRTESPRGRDLSPNPYDFVSNRSDDDDVNEAENAKEVFYGPGSVFDSQSQDEEEGDSCVETALMEASLIHCVKFLDHVADVNGGNRIEDATSMIDNSSDIDRSLSRRSMLSSDDYEESVDESNLYTNSLVSGPTAAIRGELLDLEENALIWAPPPPEDYEDEMALTMVDDDDDGEEVGSGWGSFSNSEYRFHEKANASQEQRRAMRAAVDGHFRTLVGQLLDGEGLDIDENDTDNWLEIVAALALHAASYIKPDTSKGGGMDPGGYVKVKCIATGQRRESCVIKGVVCRRNVAHRRMTSEYKNPRLLLLGGSLEYQRVPNQLSSLDTLLQQEKEHLSMTVSRIEAHRPNVVLVEKTISRQAQERLLAKDISFVLNVKRSLLERIARCTGAEIVPSPDHLLKAISGHCEFFHVEKLKEELGSGGQSGKNLMKTLMFFEGCPRPLGCTVLLKGANGDELQKVKRVVQFAVFAAYQLALETSFLVDEGATVPELTFKSPISVTLPHKPLKSDRSITTVPGFLLPAPGHIQTVTSQVTQNHNGNLGSDFAPWSVTSSCVSSRNNSPSTSPRASSRGFYTNQPGFENLDSALMSTRYPDHDSTYSRRIRYPNLTHRQVRNSSRTASGILISEVEGPEEAGSLAKVELGVGISELVTSAEAQNGSSLEVADTSCEDFPPSPSDHHSILVSFSSSCLEKRRVCERCLLYRIKYYGSFDKPLGKFLKDDVFDPSKKCAACQLSRDAHIHCYMHRQGSLVISVRNRMETLTGEMDGKIWMWHRCLKCKSVNNIPPATHRVLMSDAAWGLSFGKFLELSFSNHAAASRLAACGHSLHRDCLRFYGFGNMVACFRYASINVHTVYLPPSKLIFNIPELNDWLSAEVQEITDNGKLIFAKAFNTLREIEEKIAIFGNGKIPEVRRRIAEYEKSLRSDQDAFLETLKKAVHVQSDSGCLFADILELNSIKRSLATLYIVWWDHFLQLLSFPRLLKAVPIGRSTTLADTSSLLCNKDILESKNLSDAFEHAALSQASEVINQGESCLSGTGPPSEQIATGDIESSDEKLCLHDVLEMTDLVQENELLTLPNTFDVATNGMQTSSEVVSLEEKNPSSNIIEQAAVFPTGNKPSFYNHMLDDHLLVKRTMSEGKFVIPDLSYTFEAAWTGKGHTVEAHAVNISSTGQEILLQGSGIGSSASVDESTNLNSGADSDANLDVTGLGLDAMTHPCSPVKGSPKLDDSGACVGTPFSILYRSYSKGSQYLLNGTPQSHWLRNSYSIKLEGRLFLPLGIRDTVIPIYDEEPTSIIAYAITSHQYQAHLLDQPSDSERENELKRDRSRGKYLEFLSADTILPHPLQHTDSLSEPSGFTPKDNSNHIEELGSRESANMQNSRTIHVKVSFSDDEPQGKVKYTVTCYYARQFDALRRTCCPDQMDFIRSLCHCKKWSAQGGKSNVFFAKTKDERFVIKQVTKTELESFIKFAPEYFKYLSESLKSGSPTCLAKILGIFQVTMKNKKGGKDVRMDVMVMENLLYGRQVSQLYDLKGSTRSRYNADTTGKNKVLLDENLLESMLTTPIFIGNKAKRILERAVWNDTAFLASIDVMDYSLLVGVDEERKQLVVGIIDFMRQYTWDKHLETWVKASGILGGPKNAAPTVISPKQYKKRFRKAMKGYFLMVPDQWFIKSDLRQGENQKIKYWNPHSRYDQGHLLYQNFEIDIHYNFCGWPIIFGPSVRFIPSQSYCEMHITISMVCVKKVNIPKASSQLCYFALQGTHECGTLSL